MKKVALILMVLSISILTGNLMAQTTVVVDQTGTDFQNYWYVGTYGSQIVVDSNGKVHVAYCKTWAKAAGDTGYTLMYANVTDNKKIEIPNQELAAPIHPGVVYIGGGQNNTPIYFYYGVGSRMYGYGPEMHQQAMAKVSADGNSIEPLGLQTDKNYYHDPHYANPIAMEVDNVNGICHMIQTNPSGWELSYWNFDGTNFSQITSMYSVYPAEDVPGIDFPGQYRRNATEGADLAVSKDGQKVAVAGLHSWCNIDVTIGTLGGEVWPDNFLVGMNEGTIKLLFDTTNSAKGTNIPNNDPKPHTDLQVSYDADDNLQVVYTATYKDVWVDTARWVGGIIDDWSASHTGFCGDTLGLFYDGSTHPKPQLRCWNSTMPTLAASSTAHTLIAECTYPKAGETYKWYNYGIPDSGQAFFGKYLSQSIMDNCQLVANKDPQANEPKLVVVWEEMQEPVTRLVDADMSFSYHYYAYYSDIWVSKSMDGVTWSKPYNITKTADRDEGEVSLHPDVINNKIHMLYSEDGRFGCDRIMVYVDEYTPTYTLYTKHQGGSVPIRNEGTEQVNVVYREFDLATMTGVKSNPTEMPGEFSLEQNYPNPFNPTTSINYTVPAGNVTLDIYNMLGQKIKTLVDKAVAAGSYNVIWDGMDNAGKSVASGVYFYKLKTDAGVKIKKMVMQK